MAHFETSLTVPRSVEASFAFVSDFRHAARWDPRTYSVEKLTEGPIGLGTKFLLLGGLVDKTSGLGVHLPARLCGEMRLPYEIIVFAPPRELVLAGETDIVRYRDRIQFTPEGEGTRLTYTAELQLKGILGIGEPILQPLFEKIGRDATRGIPAAIAAGVSIGTPR